MSGVSVPDVSVVIPTYDEAENIGALIASVRQVLSRTPAPECEQSSTPALGRPLRYEIIIVDAGSNDGTLDIARKAGAVAFVQRKPGFGMALKEGFAAAKGRYVVTMDADFSHDPALLPQMLERLSEADIVIASRYVSGGALGGPLWRRILSVILNRFLVLVLRLPVKDLSGNYRAYAREALARITVTGRDFDALEEILVKAHLNGLKVVEIPLAYQTRAHGVSHARPVRFAFSYLKTLVKMFFARYLSRRGSCPKAPTGA